MAYIYQGMNLPKDQDILFACMDWGLGHASRSVPLIRALQAKGNRVSLASAGGAKEFLEDYFPELTVYSKPSYNIFYSAWVPMWLVTAQQSLTILKIIEEEKKWTERVIGSNKFDSIYSDNCYGVYSKEIPSTLITHQLMLKTPGLFSFAESILHRQILKWTSAFGKCLIPDVAGNDNLSGDLSHKYDLPANAEFIGLQSRFQLDTPAETFEDDLEVCAIISGPEPQRTFLEERLKDILGKRKRKSIIICGLPGKNDRTEKGNLLLYNHVKDAEFRGMVAKADLVISRSGYSTIMDLVTLKKKAILIPTPGQTEQEYLSRHLSGREQFKMVSQEKFTADFIARSLSS
jgi:UDP:flavonoid glycosyltransferase YjiC (YdhE family)